MLQVNICCFPRVVVRWFKTLSLIGGLGTGFSDWGVLIGYAGIRVTGSPDVVRNGVVGEDLGSRNYRWWQLETSFVRFGNLPYRFVVWIYCNWGDKIVLRNESNEKQCIRVSQKLDTDFKMNKKQIVSV